MIIGIGINLWKAAVLANGFNAVTSPDKEILARSGELILSRSGATTVGR